MLINLTPHNITVIGDKESLIIPPAGKVARVISQSIQTGTVDNVPIFATTFGDIQDLPEPQDNDFFIVSAMVRSALPDRKDILSPGDLVRDHNGNVIGCRGLISN
jgi:hypothetical protein